jgi:hypothetical protein
MLEHTSHTVKPALRHETWMEARSLAVWSVCHA